MNPNPSAWPDRRFLVASVVILGGYLGTVSLDASGVTVALFPESAVRAVLGLCLLVFVPGEALRRLLEVRELRPVDSLLVAIGSSLSLDVGIFLLLNFGGPLVGFSGPIVLEAVVLLVSFITGVMLLLLARRSELARTSRRPRALTWREKLIVAYAVSVLSLTVLGVRVVNTTNRTGVVAVAIVSIALFPVLLAVVAPTRRRAVSIAIYLVALALLFHVTLVSPYLQGRDIQVEYYFVQQVLEQHWWDPSIAHPYNSVLSVVGLIPLFSLVMGVEPAPVMRVLVPALFALVPVGLYSIVDHQIESVFDGRFAVLLFVFVGPFFYISTTLIRQMFAVLFLMLALLTAFSTDQNPVRWPMTAVFLGAMVVSHYGTAYIFGAFVVGVTVLRIGFRLLDEPRFRWSTPLPVIGVFLGTTVIWYSAVGGSTLLENLVNIFFNVIQGITTGPLIDLPTGIEGGSVATETPSTTPTETTPRSPTETATPTETNTDTPATATESPPATESSPATDADDRGEFAFAGFLPPEPFRLVLKGLYFGFFGLISLGLFSEVRGVLSSGDRSSRSVEFLALGVVAYGFFVSVLILPFFGLGFGRLVFFLFFFLLPYLPSGLEASARIGSWLSSEIDSYRVAQVSVCLLLIPFLLLTSGFVYDVGESQPKSPALSQETVHNQSLQEKYEFYNFYTIPPSSVAGASWLDDRTAFPDTRVYYTGLSSLVLQGYGNGGPQVSTWGGDTDRYKQISPATNRFRSGSYIYVSYVNTRENLASVRRFSGTSVYPYRQVEPRITRESKIYTNGDTRIYRVTSNATARNSSTVRTEVNG